MTHALAHPVLSRTELSEAKTVTASARPLRAPSLRARCAAVLYHCARVLFRHWPDYSFDDLAGIQDNLDGPAFARAARDMRSDPEGRELVRSRAILTVKGLDWAYFAKLPIDSFGYNVWHHFYVNGLLTPLELQPSRLRWAEDTEHAKSRYRSSHDMRHVFVGLGTEVHEEISLQVFQYAQLPQKLSALVVLFGALKLMVSRDDWRAFWRLAPRAWHAGKRGQALHCVCFERLWDRPLDELRARYGIAPVGDRYPVRERHPDALEFCDPFAEHTDPALHLDCPVSPPLSADETRP